MSWDKKTVFSSAGNYPNRSKWKAAEAGAYKAAARNGWLEAATAHMALKRRPWTPSELQDDAKKHTSRAAWKEASGGAYKAARELGILNTVCAHMELSYRPDGWWKVKQNVLASARKFQTLQAWNESETSAVQAARRHGWIEDATAHMSDRPMPIGPATIHEFLLSYNIPYKAEHRFKDSPEVAKMPFDFYIHQLGLIIEYQGRQHKDGWARDKGSLASIRKNDRIKKQWAIESGLNFLEIRAWTETTLTKVRARLNKVLGGNLGDPRELTAAEKRKISSAYAWDEESLMLDAAKYQSRADWMNNSSSAYRFAIRHGLAETATKHMPYIVEHGKWTRDAIIASARPYSTMTDWRTAEPSAYVISSRLGCFRAATEHMTRGKQPNGYWSDERILAEAIRFESTAAWHRESPVSYGAAKKRGLVPISMPRGKKPQGFWTKEQIAKTAAAFSRKSEFRKTEPSAYTIAGAAGWLDEVCAHMLSSSRTK